MNERYSVSEARAKFSEVVREVLALRSVLLNNGKMKPAKHSPRDLLSTIRRPTAKPGLVKRFLDERD